MQAVLTLLVADVNHGTAVGGFPVLGVPLTLDCRDSESDELTSMRALHSLQADHGSSLLGVIGELDDQVTVPLDLLAQALGIMMISPAATAPSLAVLRDHPYFVRKQQSTRGKPNWPPCKLLLISSCVAMYDRQLRTITSGATLSALFMTVRQPHTRDLR